MVKDLLNRLKEYNPTPFDRGYLKGMADAKKGRPMEDENELITKMGKEYALGYAEGYLIYDSEKAT